jgi:hypothetical protein
MKEENNNLNFMKNKRKSLNFGMWILFLGVFFLAINLGLFAYADFSKIWPIFLIIFGIILMMRGLFEDK